MTGVHRGRSAIDLMLLRQQGRWCTYPLRNRALAHKKLHLICLCLQRKQTIALLEANGCRSAGKDNAARLTGLESNLQRDAA